MTRLLSLFAAILITGCSYSYPVLARIIDGKLAFVSADPDHECISIISVIAGGERPADPAVDYLEDPGAKGDAVTRARAAWIADGLSFTCNAPFPIFYGAKLPDMPEQVKAKPLRIGVPYSVSVMGPNGSGGAGCFLVTPQRQVRNLPERDCDPIEPGPQAPSLPGVTPARARATPATFMLRADWAGLALPKSGPVRVRFLLDIRTDGWVADCRLLRSSGFPALDRATCRAMVARARFTPGIDATGFPMNSRVEQEMVWTPQGPGNIPLPGDRPLRAELILWNQVGNVARTSSVHATMAACRAELGRIAARGPATDEKAFCFEEPATNYRALEVKPPPPPPEPGQR